MLNTMPIINSSLELLFERFSKKKKKKAFSLLRVPTSYKYDKGIVQLVVPVNSHQLTHLLIAQFRKIEPMVNNSIFDDLFL